MKRKLIFAAALFLTLSLSAQTSQISKFIKGNIADKTSAVKESSGADAVWLCNKAIDFLLDSREVLGTDRELDGLAVAAILSYPQEYISGSQDSSKDQILKNFMSVFEAFDASPNVQITVISKLNSLAKDLDVSPFVVKLNLLLYKDFSIDTDISVLKSVINFLSIHGDNNSFKVVYSLWASHQFKTLENELQNAVISLIPVSMNEALAVSKNNNLDVVTDFFNLIYANKSKINENSFCLFAENVLSNTIILVNKTQNISSAVTDVQIKCVQALGEYKWTRASDVVLDYFKLSKELYDRNELDENHFVSVICCLSDTAPLDSVPALIEYLEFLNAKVEKYEPVSDSVALAVINTLGAIGDKSAFDALLGVTYFTYPQNVLSAARDALSALRW